MSLQEELLMNFGNFEEVEYLDYLNHIMQFGEDRDDRTGIGTKSIFHANMTFSLGDRIPLLTTKKMAWKSIVSELLWFLEGSTDERRLAEIHFDKDRYDIVGKRTIWTDNADNQGKALGHLNDDIVKELGPVYGKQWRNFGRVDQIRELLISLKENPTSRRHILSAWNVGELDKMALPPCHILSQFYVSNDGGLSCTLYQRSCDMFLGVPFNIASYSLLTHILAKELGYYPKQFNWVGGDVHIYKNHFDAVETQVKRMPFMFPKLNITKDKGMSEYKVSDFTLTEYKHYDTISAPMAI